MARRWAGRRRVERCVTCLVPPERCTCGWRGTARIPGADAGGHMTRELERVESLPPTPKEDFSFETMEEYRRDDR